MPLPHRSSACWSQPNADGLVVAHVGPLVEGKRRELDRRDVCPGDPTGQRRAPDPRSHHPPEGLGHIPHASTPAGSFAGSGARTAGAPTDPQRTDPRVPNAQPRTADQQRWQGFGTDKVSDQRGEHGSVGSVQARPRVGSAEHSDLVAQDEQLDVLGRRCVGEQRQPARKQVKIS